MEFEGDEVGMAVWVRGTVGEALVPFNEVVDCVWLSGMVGEAMVPFNEVADCVWLSGSAEDVEFSGAVAEAWVRDDVVEGFVTV